jgi:hypothetical protein
MRQKITERRQAEIGQVMQERNDRIKQRVAMRTMERNQMRKLICFVTSEEERITRLREEEEARKCEGASFFFAFDVNMVVQIVHTAKTCMFYMHLKFNDRIFAQRRRGRKEKKLSTKPGLMQ